MSGGTLSFTCGCRRIEGLPISLLLLRRETKDISLGIKSAYDATTLDAKRTPGLLALDDRCTIPSLSTGERTACVNPETPRILQEGGGRYVNERARISLSGHTTSRLKTGDSWPDRGDPTVQTSREARDRGSPSCIQRNAPMATLLQHSGAKNWASIGQISAILCRKTSERTPKKSERRNMNCLDQI